MGTGVTAPHARHTWVWEAKRRAFLCRRCKATVPLAIVVAADLRADMRGLTTDELLDRLLDAPIEAAP